MDHHYQFKQAKIYKVQLREGKIKKISDLSYSEILSLIDNLFIHEMQWAHGKPIYQTILSLVYFSQPDIYLEKTDEDLFRIYLDSTLQIMHICLYYNKVNFASGLW